jgi:hypothetical protein
MRGRHAATIPLRRVFWQVRRKVSAARNPMKDLTMGLSPWRRDAAVPGHFPRRGMTYTLEVSAGNAATA